MPQFVTFLKPLRDTFLQDATEDETALVERHFEYLQTQLSKGNLVLAGRCQDHPLGIVIFEAVDVDAATQLMADDPAVRGGVFSAETHSYQVALMREPG